MDVFDSNYRVSKSIDVIELVVDDNMVVFNKENISVFGFGALILTKNSNGDLLGIRDLLLSTFFETRPREIERVEKTYVLKYYSGDKFIDVPDGVVAETEVSVDNQEFFFKKLSSGRIRPAKDISAGFESILNNINLNIQLNVPFIIKEIYGSNIFRDVKKPELPARLTDNDGYVILSTRNLVANGSTHTALTFEDPTAMIVNKALGSKTKEIVSPREKYAKL